MTFEETIVCTDSMVKRITDTTKRYPWIVYEQDGCVVGYAYFSQFGTRTAFRKPAEVSVYISCE